MLKGCCDVGTGRRGEDNCLTAAQKVLVAPLAVREELASRLRPIPGGFFEMGTRRSRFAEDHDAPRHRVKLSGFAIGVTACTNADYARFVGATGYRTVAEIEGWSFVFYMLLDDPARWTASPPGMPWWRRVDGACWHAPEGPSSDLVGREDHPVVHVAWFDALAYCVWSGLKLPTEAQWEKAARGGLKRRKFPWGDEMMPGGEHAMNTWQGTFPTENTAVDGYVGTAPAEAFAPNGYGLYNLCGNVWEWTGDFYAPVPAKGPLPLRDPTGPFEGTARIQKGGSYLCHASYCDRYYVHSRTRNDPDSSTGNTGFRVSKD